MTMTMIINGIIFISLVAWIITGIFAFAKAYGNYDIKELSLPMRVLYRLKIILYMIAGPISLLMATRK